MRQTGFYAERIKPVVVIALLTAICITLVSLLHLSTAERVAANEGLVLKRAVLYAAGITVPESNSDINSLYDKRVIQEEDFFLVLDDQEEPFVYALIQAGPGLWGEIEAVVAFEKDSNRFAGVDFIKQNETPGLGARITESWFKEQLRGKEAPLRLNPEGTKSSSLSEIDALTGATRTSDYVLSIFNGAAKREDELEGRTW
jgi:Na+-transporting NADH:ubiquinone oxidoreductase subunit C